MTNPAGILRNGATNRWRISHRLLFLLVITNAFILNLDVHAGGILSSEELIEKLDMPAEPRTRGLVKTTGASVTNRVDAASPPEESGPSVVLNIPFAHNSSDLSHSAIAQLDELGSALNSQQLGGYAFEIAGHTDASGSSAYNRDLSMRRAETVKNYLNTRLGVDIGRLRTTGWGEDKPVRADNPFHADNRRVEVINLGYSQ
jgi:outer membrane protein OmpA-like peptidoglycan-associated protein